MLKKYGIAAIFLILTACDRMTDLSDKNNVDELIKHGWLPAFFAQKTFVTGQEIHEVDTNKLWGYIVPNNLELEKNCFTAEKFVPYQQPPRAMRRYWINETEFKQAQQYLCPNISTALHFFSSGNKLFFISHD